MQAVHWRETAPKQAKKKLETSRKGRGKERGNKPETGAKQAAKCTSSKPETSRKQGRNSDAIDRTVSAPHVDGRGRTGQDRPPGASARQARAGRPRLLD